MEFINNYNTFIQFLILGSMIIGSSILVLGIFLLLPKINKKGINILYAFSSGFIIPFALVGSVGGGIRQLQNEELGQLVKIIVCLASGLIAMGIYLLVKYLIIKKSKSIHKMHDAHDHSDEITNVSDVDHPNSKWVAIFLLMLHRIPAGLIIGLAWWGISHGDMHQYADHGGHEEVLTIGFFTVFVIHTVPEALIVYYRQLDMGYSKLRSFFFAIGVETLLMPFMVIAYFFADWIKEAHWFMPMILIISGVIMTLTAIAELLPGLVHNRSSSKDWYWTFLMIAIGITISLSLVVLHSH